MAMNVSREKALSWIAQGATVLLLLVAAYAVMLYLKVDELETSVSQVRADSDKAGQASAAARKKMQDELNAASARAAELEKKQRETDNMRALLAKIEPQVAPMLEAAAKAGKPDARAAAITGVGLLRQIARGANDDAALGALVRALAIDKANCVAGLALNLGGNKTIEVAPDCQALLPAPAAGAKPAAEAKPAAAPAGGAGKAAQPAGKS